jgi:hypothetical protein
LTENIFRLLSCFALAGALVPALAQTPAPPSAPAGATTKVFISNLTSRDLAPDAVGPGPTYNRLYAALQNLESYQVVMDPAQADLIFEVSYNVTWYCDTNLFSGKRIGLTIWDAKTHVERRSWDRDVSVASLLKHTGITGATVPKKPAPAPVPPQISAARTVFLSNVVEDKTQRVKNPGAMYDLVKAALEQWGQYKLVTRAADADLIMELAFTGENDTRCGNEPPPSDLAIELRIVSAGTNTALWDFSQQINWSETLFHRTMPQKRLKTGASRLVDQLRRFALASAAPGQPK